MAGVESMENTKSVVSNAIVARLAGKIVDFDMTNFTKQAPAQPGAASSIRSASRSPAFRNLGRRYC